MKFGDCCGLELMGDAGGGGWPVPRRQRRRALGGDWNGGEEGDGRGERDSVTGTTVLFCIYH